MPNQVIWSPLAKKDLNETLEYINNNWSFRAVNKFINRIDESIKLITDNYLLFPLISKEKNIRKCVVSKHISVYYRYKQGKIEIIRLFDSRQDPNKLMLK